MSEQPENLDEPLDEKLTELVSYLDGELDDTQMNEVEQILITDAAARSHADILSRTWALLDSLEEVSASGQFTQETLATISAEVIKDEGGPSGKRLKDLTTALARYQIVPYFLLGVLGAGVGLTMAGTAEENREAESNVEAVALQHIDLLPSIELYDLVPNVDALKELGLSSEKNQTEPDE
jgi:anti-sigma factor RsiW